jgi:hypothetical protein
VLTELYLDPRTHRFEVREEEDRSKIVGTGHISIRLPLVRRKRRKQETTALDRSRAPLVRGRGGSLTETMSLVVYDLLYELYW